MLEDPEVRVVVVPSLEYPFNVPLNAVDGITVAPVPVVYVHGAPASETNSDHNAILKRST